MNYTFLEFLHFFWFSSNLYSSLEVPIQTMDELERGGDSIRLVQLTKERWRRQIEIISFQCPFQSKKSLMRVTNSKPRDPGTLCPISSKTG